MTKNCSKIISTSPAMNTGHSGSKTPSQIACLECRSVKLKCRAVAVNEKCERCNRKSLECVFEQHRRGRKLGTRIKRNIQRDNAQIRSAPISKQSDLPPNAIHEVGRPISPHPPLRGQVDAPESPPEIAQSWGKEGLQQAERLIKEVKFEDFSMENVLSIPYFLIPRSAPMRSPIPGVDKFNDPIACNILSFPVALGLFESFMRCLNPYICQLDPKLHTFDYVRHRSAFLLTAILSASSKAFHPALHPTLRSHADNLLGTVFTRGTKSTETVQAILIFTHWKEPAEIRTWLLVGYAIRMSIELGWHELEPVSHKPRTARDEISIREARNIERTWLLLFLYDRGLSLQLDKPCMLDQNNLISKGSEWYQEKYAVPGGDMVLSAFVRLRLISTEIIELASSMELEALKPRSENLSKLLNTEINIWEKDWLPKFENETVAPPHRFLVNFYSSHLRLLLNSYTLQHSLKFPNKGVAISKFALWKCSSSAIDMLDKISNFIGPLKQLYFVQDSVHEMTAYAAIFLIKLLVALPKNFRSGLETQSLQAILLSSESFSRQCATQMTGCAIQARFLKNLVDEYQRFKSENSNESRDLSINSHHSNTPMARDDLQNRMNTDINNNHQVPGNMQNYQGARDFTDNNSTNGSATDLSTDFINDNETWEEMLIDDGFWMYGANTLSDNTVQYYNEQSNPELTYWPEYLAI